MKATLKRKIEVYEGFLQKLASSYQSNNQESLQELLKNADRWAYAQEQPREEKENERFQQWAFRTLCNTPASDSKERKRLRELEKSSRLVQKKSRKSVLK